MQREFTRDVGNYKRGYIPAGWSLSTWEQVARSAGLQLHAFSRPLEAIAVRQGDKPLAGQMKEAA